jgi:FMN phosphatase YigB (HAD superfamily)
VIKAVFFDWFNTLAHFDPPREELYQKAFQEHGFELSYKTIYQGLQVGDQFILSNRKHKTVRPKTLDTRLKLYLCYTQAIGEIAGIMLPDDIQTSIIKRF